MDLGINDAGKSMAGENPATQVEAGAVRRDPGHSPQVTVVEVKRTMTAPGPYFDLGDGSAE